MNDGEEQSTESELYLLVNSLKRRSNFLGIGFGALVVLILFHALFTYVGMYEIENFGVITESFNEQCPDGADFSINQDTICYDFEPFSGISPNDVVAEYYQMQNAINVWIWVWILVIGGPLTYTYWGIRTLRKKMQSLSDDFIRDAYFSTIELSAPQGKDRASRIFNLLKDVMPELKDHTQKNISSKESESDEWSFEFETKTKVGKIYVAFFPGKLTSENFKKFLKKEGFSVGSNVSENDRIICIAKEFDEYFDKVDNIEFPARVDILKEEEDGFFSAVRID